TKMRLCPRRREGTRMTADAYNPLRIEVLLWTYCSVDISGALFQRFRFQARFALSGALFRPVFADPRLPAFARCGIAARKRECRYFGIRKLHSLIGIFGQ